MKTFLLSLFIFPFLIFFSCSRHDEQTFYHAFKDNTWPRFNKIRFEIPLNATAGNYDVSLFIRHDKSYEFDALDFNMIMTTPSGEERIKEYHMNIRKRDGGYWGNCQDGSCEVSIGLKNQIALTNGMLTIEIENLVPRMEAAGLLGIGIRLRPS